MQCTSDIRDTLGQMEVSLISDCPLYQKHHVWLVVYEVSTCSYFLAHFPLSFYPTVMVVVSVMNYVSIMI